MTAFGEFSSSGLKLFPETSSSLLDMTRHKTEACESIFCVCLSLIVDNELFVLRAYARVRCYHHVIIIAMRL